MADEGDHNKRVVLLLKSKSKDDNYERLLNEHGYKSVFVPVLSFKFINREELTERLKYPENHSGLIFTSQRSVEAVQFCVTDSAFEEKWRSSFKEKWSQLPVFVTGKATGKQAREKLQFSSIFGEDSGNAEALASVILNTIPANQNKELLFPCANIKKETLPNIMKEKGYALHCITAYCTQPDLRLLESFQKLFAENKAKTFISPSSSTPSTTVGKRSECIGDTLETSTHGTSDLLGSKREILDESSEVPRQPSCIVFFSPSGVTFAHDALLTMKSFESIKLVAIGQSTALELQKHKLHVSGVPEKPDPHSLLEVIDSILG